MEDRTKYIGGSDVGAILGVNPWRSPLDVFYEKTGLVESENIENEKMYWGKKIEPLIIEKFNNQFDYGIEASPPIKFHKKYPFLAAHVDAIVSDKQNLAILECKTSSSFKKNEWGETSSSDIPIYYKMQVAHYLNIYDLPRAFIAVLFGNFEFKYYEYSRDLKFEEEIEEKLVNFWENNVLKLEPPLPISIEEAKKLYVNAEEGKTIVADNEIINIHDKICDLSVQCSLLEKQIDENKLILMNFMKDNETIISNNGEILCTWKNRKSKKLDQQSLKIDYPEVYNNYLKDLECRTFLLKNYSKE